MWWANHPCPALSEQLGSEDHSRNVRGVADPLDEEERLVNLISDRISPRLMPEIEILPWRQTQVLALPQALRSGTYCVDSSRRSHTWPRILHSTRSCSIEPSA
jgi:hypothetical protein